MENCGKKTKFEKYSYWLIETKNNDICKACVVVVICKDTKSISEETAFPTLALSAAKSVGL